MFLAVFDLRSSIVSTCSIATYPVCVLIQWIRNQNDLKQELRVIYIFQSCFCWKKIVSTSDSEQSKTLLTIDERGSKLARNSVLIAKCRLFDEARVVVKNYDANYFWSLIVDSIDVFDCAYKAWFCCMLHDVTVDIFFKCFCLKGKYSQLFGYCKGGTSWLRYSSTLDIGKIWKWGVITTFESACLLFNKSIEANSVDPDQTASRWAVCSRSTVFV